MTSCSKIAAPVDILLTGSSPKKIIQMKRNAASVRHTPEILGGLEARSV
jgi:hypothetical protein